MRTLLMRTDGANENSANEDDANENSANEGGANENFANENSANYGGANEKLMGTDMKLRFADLPLLQHVAPKTQRPKYRFVARNAVTRRFEA